MEFMKFYLDFLFWFLIWSSWSLGYNSPGSADGFDPVSCSNSGSGYSFSFTFCSLVLLSLYCVGSASGSCSVFGCHLSFGSVSGCSSCTISLKLNLFSCSLFISFC